MSRQHSVPLLLPRCATIGVPLAPLCLQASDDAVSEADIQALVHAHPECLPIAEIDPMFMGAVSICTELNTPAGTIDNFMVTPSGLPVLVECKLWRNPEARREVVGQILDYAKELSRWSSSDLKREVNRRLKRNGDALLAMVRAADRGVDEKQFHDWLTANLRRGRFLLLIVGDGIREGVEAIAEYLQSHAGLHFSLGLVELPIYLLPDGSRLVTPRVLARTAVIGRNLVHAPESSSVRESEGTIMAPVDMDPEQGSLQEEQQRFWAEFLAEFSLDDPEQPIPKPARQGFLGFMLPAPSGSSWLTVYRDTRNNEVGVFLSYGRKTAGEYAAESIVADWQTVKDQLGGTAKLIKTKDGRDRIIDSLVVAPLQQPEVRKQAFAWLAERVNTFVNVMRPRVRSAVADYRSRNAQPGAA